MMNKLKLSENAKLKQKLGLKGDQEDEFLRNLNNAGRELNSLYQQNQDLFG
jgi:uncharacterized tellurite resistance protein B-like protein